MQASFIFADDPDDFNCSYYRLAGPAQALRVAGHEINLLSGLSGRQPNQQDRDLLNVSELHETVLLERVITYARLERLRLAGAKRIVVTFDDHYSRLTPGTNAYEYWHTQKHLQEMMNCLRQGLVDAVIVPSQYLAQAWAPWFPEIQVVPNYLDAAEWRPAADTHQQLYEAWCSRPDLPLTLGWGGTIMHQLCWSKSTLPQALRQLQLARGEQLRFRFFHQVVDPYLRRAGLEYERVAFQPRESWPQALASLDVVVAPLYGEYDAARSNLKVLEAATLGIPWVGTDLPPFRQAQGGVLVPENATADDWRQAIEVVLADLAGDNKLGLAGWLWAQQYALHQCVPVYEQLLWPELKEH